MKITYVGPHDAVDVVDEGELVVTVERGAEVDVTPSLARRLLEQDVWSSPDQKRASQKKEQR